MHLIAAVIVDEPKLSLVEEALEPYREDYTDACTSKYKKFHSVYEECKNKYDEEDEDIKALYPTLKEYIGKACKYEWDEEMNDYGYWENPNAKWDWYNICPKGTTERYISTTDDFIQVKDFPKGFTIDIYNEYIRLWEIVVEGKPLKEGEEEPFNLYSKEYYIETYKNKNDFATINATPHCWAFIFDGKWYEKGEPNIFGERVTKESIIEYLKTWQRVINDPKNRDKYIAIVKCHY